MVTTRALCSTTLATRTFSIPSVTRTWRRIGSRTFGETETTLGELLAEIAIVVATICYACGAIFSRGFKGLDPMAPAVGSLCCGTAMLIPLSLVCERPWTLAPSATSLSALLALAVFSTAAAFVIYFRLIQTLGSVGTTAQAYLRVPIGVALSVTFLGERLAPTAWLGLACVVVGVAAMTIPARDTAALKTS